VPDLNLTLDDYEGMLHELLNDQSDGISAWEVEFIESLNRRPLRHDAQGRAVAGWSEKQCNKLREIWDRVLG